MTYRDHPTLWLMRHGQTEWNAEGRMQGRLDSPLTDLGRAHAAAQARLLSAEAPGPEVAFYTSPLGRTLATAAIVFAGFGRDVVQDPRLMEISVGDCEGLTRPEIAARFPDLAPDDNPWGWYLTAPGGEGYDAFRARVAGFLDDLRGPAAIVTHGMTSRMIRGVILGLDWAAMMRLPGGQGNIYRMRGGQVDELA